MRILFDSQAFSFQARGGISRYVIELARRLAAYPDIEPRVFAGWHRSELLRDSTASWAVGRYVPHFPKTTPLRRALNTILTRRYAKRWRPDILHETYFRRGSTYVANVPTVLTLYDLIYFVLPQAGADAARVRRAQQAAIARADRIICISEQTRRDLLRFVPVAPHRISVVPLAPLPLSPPRHPAPPAPLEAPYVLHVGLRNGYKNFDLLLRAFAQSGALRRGLRIVSFADAPFSAGERTRIRQLGLDGIVVHQRGGDELLARFYGGAVALAFPSLYEGFGLPPLEAMLHGCPVVCSSAGALDEVTGDAALKFEPTSHAALASALERLQASPELAADLRVRGIRQAARFSWERCAAETVEVYRSVLSERGH